MSPHRLSRREFLRGSALAGIGLGLAPLVAACDPGAVPPRSGSPGVSSPGSPSPIAPAPTGPLSPTGPMTFANWDRSIDLNADGVTSPTIEAFEAEHGVRVDYANAAIEDNEAFVATLRPQLERGVEPGWDLAVLSDWMVARLVANGWLERLDPAHVPTARRNLRPELAGQPWDPDQSFHYPWASFATGIAWHRLSTGRDLAGLEDLFDPAFAGRVTLLRSARETLPMIHLLRRARGEAADRGPADMTVEDARAAIDVLRPHVESGQIAGFTVGEHLVGLLDGSLAVALASSRDLVPVVGEAQGFAYPSEGWLLASENLVIPRAAKHRYTAELLIDWVYDALRAARIAAAVGGISPVRGIATHLPTVEGGLDRDAPGWPLLFPPAGVRGRQHHGPLWDEETEAQIEELFAELTDA